VARHRDSAAGWLGGFLGNRNLFVAIMVGFVLTSIACGLAVDIHMLIICRLVQGFVLGPIEGLTAVLMIQAFPPEQRGMAIGLRSIGWSAGQIVSFTLGGYCLEQLSWRMIFFLGIPSGIVAAILGLFLIPQQREYRGIPVDYPGLLALAMFLVPLTLGISLARRDDAETSTLLLLGLVTVAGSGIFITRELRAQFPVVNLRLFALPAFRCLCCTAILNMVGLFGAQFMIPIFLQQVMGYTPRVLGTVRNIGAALGVTITSVIFEHRRTAHQLLSYSAYNVASPQHLHTVREVEHVLRGAGIHETDVPAMALRSLRQQIDIEAVAAGFRDSFFAISFCFLLAMLCMIGVVRVHQPSVRKGA
jgi:DHA2 family multidrug resistance protein